MTFFFSESLLYSSCMIHIFLIEIKLLLCDNLVILALGITHFTWIKGQHIVVNLLLIKPFWRTKSSFILKLPTRVMTFLFL